MMVPQRLSGVWCVNKLMKGLAAALLLLARQPGPSCVHTLPDLYDANETQCRVLLEALTRAKWWICGRASLEITPLLCYDAHHHSPVIHDLNEWSCSKTS